MPIDFSRYHVPDELPPLPYDVQPMDGGVPVPGSGFRDQPGIYTRQPTAAQPRGALDTMPGGVPVPPGAGRPPASAPAGGDPGGTDFDARITAILRQRYGPNFDINDPERGLPYFKRRAAESAAEGDARSLDYWAERASGTVEAQHAAAQNGGMPSGYSNDPNGPVASFNAPGLAAPYTKEFQPMSADQFYGSDTFQAAMKEAEGSINRSASARGTTFTGGTLKDLQDRAIGLALPYYNDQFNRDATTYGTNRDTFWGNQNNAFSKLNQFTQTGQNGAATLQNAGTTYGNQTNTNANNSAGLTLEQANARAAAQAAGAAGRKANLNNLLNNLSSIATGR